MSLPPAVPALIAVGLVLLAADDVPPPVPLSLLPQAAIATSPAIAMVDTAILRTRMLPPTRRSARA